MDAVDQRRRRQTISGVRIGQHYEVADDRWHEEERGRGDHVRPCLAVGARQRLRVEGPNPAPNATSAAVYDAMAASDEPVEIPVHRLTRPVSLRAGEVGRRATVQRGHGEDLAWGQPVELPGAGVRDEVLEAVPVVLPSRYELFAAHQALKIAEWGSRSPIQTWLFPRRSAFPSTTRSPGWVREASRRSSTSSSSPGCSWRCSSSPARRPRPPGRTSSARSSICSAPSSSYSGTSGSAKPFSPGRRWASAHCAFGSSEIAASR